MSEPPIGDRLNSNVDQLRLLLREYRLLSEDKQKEARNILYKRHGSFGKFMTKELFPKFEELEKGHSLRLMGKQA